MVLGILAEEIGEAWLQTERLFEYVNQSSITFYVGLLKDSFFTFYAKRLVCQTIGSRF